jgi:Uncharacterized conserved protein, contains double-stranded beta-helix domain
MQRGAIITLLTEKNYTMNGSELFPKGEKAAANFTGDAWVKMLSANSEIFDAIAYNVTFSAGSRNFWHVHSGGQILICISGEGYYQEKGLPARKLQVGDIVEIKPNVVHWHGATVESQFEHIGITPQVSKNQVTWLEPVSDEEYGSIK